MTIISPSTGFSIYILGFLSKFGMGLSLKKQDSIKYILKCLGE
jgi:hypothetical protein